MACNSDIASKMKHRVTVQTLTRTSDNQGGYTESWANTKQVWADIKPMKAYEKFQAQQMQSPATHKITIRYYKGLTAAHRLTFNARIFDLKEVINVDEANAFMKLIAVEN